MAALGEPVHELAERNADAHRYEERQPRDHGQRPASEVIANRRPPRSLAHPGVVRVSAQLRLAESRLIIGNGDRLRDMARF